MTRKSKDNYEEEKKKPDDNEDTKDSLEEKTGEDPVMIPIVLTKNPRAKKFTIPKQKNLLKYLIKEFNVGKAAHKVGISRRYVYMFLKNNPSFKTAFEEIKESHLDDIECNLISEGKTRNFTPGIFMLKSHRRSVYGDKLDIDVDVAINIETEGQVKAILARLLPPPDDDDVVDADFREIPDKKEDKEKDNEDNKRDREVPD